MHAVIIAGGAGTRLRPFTFSIPKPLLPVGEKPILEYTIRRLRTLGITNITLTLGYGAELIEAYFGDGRRFGVDIKYTREKKPLGTAGPLRLIRGLKAPVLVMNGDILTRLDFNRLRKFHTSNGADMTIAVRKYADRLPFGTVEFSGDSVTGITEKPATQYLISTGIYMLGKGALDAIPRNAFFTMPDLIKTLLKRGRRVVKFEFKDYWLGIEQVSQLEEATQTAKAWTDRA
jgi:NDP-sugar pyrophosphorylase family protein